MVGTATAAYFLLTADYGPEPNALDPVSSHTYVFSIFFLLYLFIYLAIFWVELGHSNGPF